MDFNVKLSSNSGTVEDSKNTIFNFINTEDILGCKITIKNISNNTILESFIVDNLENYFSKKIDLKISDNFNQSEVTIFVEIEEKNDLGGYKLKNIIPILYSINYGNLLNNNEVKISINPSVVGIYDTIQIIVNTKKNNRIILEINGKKFTVMINEQGIGSFHLKARSIVDYDNIVSINRFPLYFYCCDDKNKYISGSFINIVPDNIKKHISNTEKKK